MVDIIEQLLDTDLTMKRDVWRVRQEAAVKIRDLREELELIAAINAFKDYCNHD